MKFTEIETWNCGFNYRIECGQCGVSDIISRARATRTIVCPSCGATFMVDDSIYDKGEHTFTIMQ